MPPFLWTQKQDIGPSGRAGLALAEDPLRHRALLFGGRNRDAALSDTWLWDGELWTQVGDTGPSPRHGHSMAFDEARGQVLLFGGLVPGSGPVQDTWAWDGERWTEVADTGPSERAGHALAYDSRRGQTLLFGGRGTDLVGDTWSWDGAEWTQLADIGPSARHGHVMTDLPGDGHVLLFGGNGAGGADLGDTWVWDGVSWSAVADTGPEPRAGAGLIGAGSAAVLFGGVSVSPGPAPVTGEVRGDTWRWLGDAWTQIQDIGPSPRFDHGMAYRTGGDRIVVFGGASRYVGDEPDQAIDVVGDTWEQLGALGPLLEPVAVPIEVASISIDVPRLVPGGSMLVTVRLTRASPDGVGVLTHTHRGDGLGGELVHFPDHAMPISVSLNGGQIQASFVVTRLEPAPPVGVYTLAMVVQGGSVVRGAKFTID